MDAVEEMLKKQEDFEKMLAGQEEKFHMLIRETKVSLPFLSRLGTYIGDSVFLHGWHRCI